VKGNLVAAASNNGGVVVVSQEGGRAYESDRRVDIASFITLFSFPFWRP
jgi:hypothetical protein